MITLFVYGIHKMDYAYKYFKDIINLFVAFHFPLIVSKLSQVLSKKIKFFILKKILIKVIKNLN